MAATPANVLDPFGIWTAQPSDASVTFALQEPDGPGPAVWRVEWSADATADSRALAAADARLASAARAMDSATARLHGAVQQLAHGPSYGPPAAAPEAMLGLLLAATDTSAEVVFGTSALPTVWSHVLDEFQATLGATHRLLAYPAWVESATAGRPMGRTIVQWTGDQCSLWPPAITRSEMARHERAVDTAIRTRAAFLRMVAVIARAAAVLGSAATPLGPLLALPAAWKFVDEVIREVRWVREQP